MHDTTKTHHRHIGLVLILLWCYRLSFIGRGAGELWDESRYFFSMEGVRLLVNGRFDLAAKAILQGTLGRPGGVVWWLPSIAYQLATSDGHPDSVWLPQNLLIPQVENCIITGMLSYCVYLIGRSWFSLSPRASLCAMAWYSVLMSSNLYVRHLLSYDPAILTFLLTLLLLKKCEALLPEQRAILAGSLGGIMFLIYPGYYFGPLVLAMLIGAPQSGAVKKSVCFTMSLCATGCLLAVIDGVGKLGGATYAAALKGLSNTILLGDFSESLTFPITYLLAVEGISGLAICCGVGMMLLNTAQRLRRGHTISPGELLTASISMCLLLHALQGILLHKMVWYGRLVHFFVPVLTLAAVQGAVSITQLLSLDRQKLVKRGLTSVCVLAISAKAWATWSDLQSVYYPRDALYELGMTSQVINPQTRTACSPCWHSSPQWRHDLEGVPVDPDYNANMLLHNFCSGLFGVRESNCQSPASIAPTRVLLQHRHYQSLSAYQFENSKPEERDSFRGQDIFFSAVAVPHATVPSEAIP